MVDIGGVIIGSILTLITSIIIYFWRDRREDKLRKEQYEREDKIRQEQFLREDELRNQQLHEKRVAEAHEYFRKHFDKLKPFLVANTKLERIMSGFNIPIGQILSVMADKELVEILESINQATQILIDGGYAALFPEKLYKSIISMRGKYALFELVKGDKALVNINEGEIKWLEEIMDSFADIKEQIRYLLNVDALELP